MFVCKDEKRTRAVLLLLLAVVVVVVGIVCLVADAHAIARHRDALTAFGAVSLVYHCLFVF